MGNRCTNSLLGLLFLTLTGCHHWCPYSYNYGYDSCVHCGGYDCGCGDCSQIYDYDQPFGRRHHRRGHMRQPCPCCGRPMPAGMMGMGFNDCFGDCGGCFDMCGMGCGCGCGSCFSDCGTCFSSCGDCYSGMSSSCGCGNCGTYSNGQSCQTCESNWQSSSQYSDCNTGWQNGQSQQSTQGSQPMSTDDYYVPSQPMPMGNEAQPTEASGAQFLMPMTQQGNAVQPILWAPPTR